VTYQAANYSLIVGLSNLAAAGDGRTPDLGGPMRVFSLSRHFPPFGLAFVPLSEKLKLLNSDSMWLDTMIIELQCGIFLLINTTPIANLF
jgi:hypothetical protein